MGGLEGWSAPSTVVGSLATGGQPSSGVRILASMVNPAIHASQAAAAKARRDLLARLRHDQAIDVAHAVELEDLPRLQAQALERLVGEGVIRRAMERRYFLDERQLKAFEERLRQKARLVFLSLLVAAIALLSAIGLSLATR